MIVLKQRTNFPARWLDDLLHEFRHAGEEPAELSRTVLEAPETSEERRKSEEEIEATLFASDVVLDGRAEEIVKKCVEATKRNGSGSGRLELLKSVVPAVAREGRCPRRFSRQLPGLPPLAPERELVGSSSESSAYG